MLLLPLAALVSIGCAGTTAYERGALSRADSAQPPTARVGSSVRYADIAMPHGAGPEGEAGAIGATGGATGGATTGATDSVLGDGTLDSYLAYAVRDNPALVAARATWRASLHRIAPARRLPDPQLGYGLFARRVETRVGPQRHRFSARQTIPWPGKRRAAAAVAAQLAEADEHRYQAELLAIQARVGDVYWQLWALVRERRIARDHRAVLADLAALTRARIAIGKATVADLTRVDLAISQVDDGIERLGAQAERARAALRRAIGAPSGTATPIAELSPVATLPAETAAALRDAARAHPALAVRDAMARAQDAAADRARADGWPDLTLALDYIETGAAPMAGQPDDGKDPIIASVTLSIPIWRGSYRAAERAARADAEAHRARRRDAERAADAAVDDALAEVADTARRIDLYTSTLIPQGETVYAATLGGYQSGAETLADALAARHAVHELHRQALAARAAHARAWARLEGIVGRSVVTRLAQPEPAAQPPAGPAPQETP